ncbi:MAG: hypothetical protein AB7W16_16420 [Candidatus Obscuribacterales bacterium]
MFDIWQWLQKAKVIEVGIESRDARLESLGVHGVVELSVRNLFGADIDKIFVNATLDEDIVTVSHSPNSLTVSRKETDKRQLQLEISLLPARTELRVFAYTTEPIGSDCLKRLQEDPLLVTSRDTSRIKRSRQAHNKLEILLILLVALCAPFLIYSSSLYYGLRRIEAKPILSFDNPIAFVQKLKDDYQKCKEELSNAVVRLEEIKATLIRKSAQLSDCQSGKGKSAVGPSIDELFEDPGKLYALRSHFKQGENQRILVLNTRECDRRAASLSRSDMRFDHTLYPFLKGRCNDTSGIMIYFWFYPQSSGPFRLDESERRELSFMLFECLFQSENFYKRRAANSEINRWKARIFRELAYHHFLSSLENGSFSARPAFGKVIAGAEFCSEIADSVRSDDSADLHVKGKEGAIIHSFDTSMSHSNLDSSRAVEILISTYINDLKRQSPEEEPVKYAIKKLQETLERHKSDSWSKAIGSRGDWIALQKRLSSSPLKKERRDFEYLSPWNH